MALNTSMMIKVKIRKIIIHTFIIIISTLLTTTLFMVGANYYVKRVGVNRVWGPGNWIMTEKYRFSLKYIYWSRSWCELNPQKCQFTEEKILPFPVKTYVQNNVSACSSHVRIMFVGDSFTLAPWTRPGDTYSDEFARNYANFNAKCVTLFRLASSGVGTDQEFARFLDVLDVTKPNIVVWQFYYNDFYDNIKQALFDVQNENLVRRSTWNNNLYIAGFLNSHIPFLWPSALGIQLLNNGLLIDPFRSWPASTNNYDEVIKYNTNKMMAILQYLNKIATDNKFSLFTTSAPLECKIVESIPCRKTVASYDEYLHTLLVNNSVFINMEAKPTLATDNIVNQENDVINYGDMFNTTDDKGFPGTRHFSNTGHIYFGRILFENYKSKILSGNL